MTYACNSLAELDALDEGEMFDGYRDGYSGEPEPGGNRSPSYQHGWWTGAVDGKHRPKPQWLSELAHDHALRSRARAA